LPAVPGTDPVDASVIVPAYRAERTLHRCVSALLQQQSEGRFEVIVVASADRTEQLPVIEDDPRRPVCGRLGCERDL